MTHRCIQGDSEKCHLVMLSSYDGLECFTIEMAFICADEDKAGKEQKRSHSGLRRVFVTQAADAATSRWATVQS